MEHRYLLETENLSRDFAASSWFSSDDRTFSAVKNVTLRLQKGEIMGLLGESGCGKTTLARMLTGLLKPTEGIIRYEGTETQGLSARRFRPLRRKIQMIFQNPFDSLDPVKTIRKSMLEPLRLWKIGENDGERITLIVEMLRKCGLPDDILSRKPAEFSGGQLQRLSIARALLPRPEFIVADEIVSALDVSIQNQILELLCAMKEEYDLTVLFISHDLAVVRHISDRITVMKDGRVLKTGPTEDVLQAGDDSYIRELTEAGFGVAE